MLLIFLRIRVGNNLVFNGFDVDFINYILKEIDGEDIGLVDINIFIILLDVADVAVYHIQHKFIYVQNRMNFMPPRRQK